MTARHFDRETIAVMKKALDDAWSTLPPDLRATTLKTTLAVQILETAAGGERDHGRLRDAALTNLAA